MADLAGINSAFSVTTQRSASSSEEEQRSAIDRIIEQQSQLNTNDDATRVDQANQGQATQTTPQTGTDQNAQTDTRSGQAQGRVIEDQVTLSAAGQQALAEQTQLAAANDDDELTTTEVDTDLETTGTVSAFEDQTEETSADTTGAAGVANAAAEDAADDDPGVGAGTTGAAASAIAAADPDSTDATARSSAASAFEATAGTDPAETTDATTGAETGIAAASDVGTATETNQTVREEQDTGVVSGNRDTSQLGSQGRELGQIVDQFA